MPVFIPYDDQFNDRKHSELGQRNFTVSHARKDGLVMTAISMCLLVAACVLFAMVNRYELFALYGALAAFLGLLLGAVGLNTIYRSRVTVHVYDEGAEKVVGGVRSCINFVDVTECELIFASKGLNTGFGMKLSDGTTKIRIWDSLGRWDTESTNRYNSLANKIAEKIPKDVKITGIHCAKPESG